jgi:hypothetical protein
MAVWATFAPATFAVDSINLSDLNECQSRLKTAQEANRAWQERQSKADLDLKKFKDEQNRAFKEREEAEKKLAEAGESLRKIKEPYVLVENLYVAADEDCRNNGLRCQEVMLLEYKMKQAKMRVDYQEQVEREANEAVAAARRKEQFFIQKLQESQSGAFSPPPFDQEEINRIRDHCDWLRHQVGISGSGKKYFDIVISNFKTTEKEYQFPECRFQNLVAHPTIPQADPTVVDANLSYLRSEGYAYVQAVFFNTKADQERFRAQFGQKVKEDWKRCRQAQAAPQPAEKGDIKINVIGTLQTEVGKPVTLKATVVRDPQAVSGSRYAYYWYVNDHYRTHGLDKNTYGFNVPHIGLKAVKTLVKVKRTNDGGRSWQDCGEAKYDFSGIASQGTSTGGNVDSLINYGQSMQMYR